MFCKARYIEDNFICTGAIEGLEGLKQT